MPFKLNPFTNKPDYYETGGGGGGEITISTPEGDATSVGGVINFDSPNGGFQISGDTVTFTAFGDTKYTVSQIPGQANYTSIQDAADAFVFDGANGSYIRVYPGNTPYVENLVLNNDQMPIVGAIPYNINSNAPPVVYVEIDGQHTFPTVFQSQNIKFLNLAAAAPFTITSGQVLLGNNCSYASFASSIESGGGGTIYLENCTTQSDITITGVNFLGRNCLFANIVSDSSIVNLQWSSCSNVTMTNGSQLSGSNSVCQGNFSADNTCSIDAALFKLNQPPTGGATFTPASTFSTQYGFTTVGGNTQGITYNALSSYNIAPADRTIVNDTSGGAVDNYFLELAGGAQVGQLFTVKDGTGNAVANPITGTTLAGTTTFDGATSFTVNLAYGSRTFQMQSDGNYLSV